VEIFHFLSSLPHTPPFPKSARRLNPSPLKVNLPEPLKRRGPLRLKQIQRFLRKKGKPAESPFFRAGMPWPPLDPYRKFTRALVRIYMTHPSILSRRTNPPFGLRHPSSNLRNKPLGGLLRPEYDEHGFFKAVPSIPLIVFSDISKQQEYLLSIFSGFTILFLLRSGPR